MQPVGVHLLLVEVDQVLLEDVVRRPVGLAEVLQELKQTGGRMNSLGVGFHTVPTTNEP